MKKFVLFVSKLAWVVYIGFFAMLVVYGFMEEYGPVFGKNADVMVANALVSICITIAYLTVFRKPKDKKETVEAINLFNRGEDDLWNWFGLGYASWLTIPRVLMHEMSDEWQGKMAKLLREFDDVWDTSSIDATTIISLKGSKTGRFIRVPDWLCNYRHPDHKTIDRHKRKNHSF